MAARKKKVAKKSTAKKSTAKKSTAKSESSAQPNPPAKSSPARSSKRRPSKRRAEKKPNALRASGAKAYTPDQRDGIIAIVEKCLGQGMGVVASSERAGVSAVTIWKWRKEDPDLDERLTKAGQVLVEHATASLAQAVKKGDRRSIEFFLSRRSPDFMERQRVEVTTPDEWKERIEVALRELRHGFIPEPPDDEEVAAIREEIYE